MVLQLCSSFLLLKQIMVGVFDTADALRRPGASSGGTLRRGDDPPHAPREHHGGPTEVSSGETINKVVPSVVTSFRISRVDKINSTAVVFHALGGEQIRVWNGITTVRLSATSAEIPVCSANVTCAAFQVEGGELAAKYLAEAEALLVPFAAGRCRLAERCLDPLTSGLRNAAQVPAAGGSAAPLMFGSTRRSFLPQGASRSGCTCGTTPPPPRRSPSILWAGSGPTRVRVLDLECCLLLRLAL